MLNSISTRGDLMNRFDISTLSFNQINIFIHAANLQSFSEAAKALHVTQPLVSRTISNLEEQFGFPLFKRNHRLVELTPAGLEVLNHWTSLYYDAQKSLDTIYSIYGSKSHSLTVVDDFIESSSNYLSAILDDFKNTNPEIKVHIEKMHPVDLIDSIREGASDVGFIFEPELKQANKIEFEYKKIAAGNYCLMVSKEHPLYNHKSITLDELSNVPIAVIHRNHSHTYYENIISLFAQKNLIPRISSYVTSTPSLLYSCQHEGLGMISHSFVSKQPFFNYIPITDSSCSMNLIWKKNNTKYELSSFIDVACKVMQTFKF